MRILIVDAYYPRFLLHALQDLDVTALSYDEFLNRLLRLRFGTSDFYSRNLRDLECEASDVVFNCEPLQHQWAKEHGIPLGGLPHQVSARLGRLPFIGRWFESRDTLLEIAQRQIRHIRPDVLYVQDLNVFPPKLLAGLKDAVRLIVGQIACPLPQEEYLRSFDLLLTSFPHYVGRFRAMGIESEYFKIGFDPIILNELGSRTRTRSCTFVGGISSAHGKRTTFLEQLADAVDIEFFGYGVENLPPTSHIVSRHHGEAWAMDMYRVLSESRITVNVHIDVAEDFANNMRLYEATGCGALLLTDQKSNLHEMFVPGKEVVAYRNVEEAIELIRYYKERPSEAAAVAQAGQARTLRDHTYRQRMKELIEILNRHLRKG